MDKTKFSLIFIKMQFDSVKQSSQFLDVSLAAEEVTEWRRPETGSTRIP